MHKRNEIIIVMLKILGLVLFCALTLLSIKLGIKVIDKTIILVPLIIVMSILDAYIVTCSRGESRYRPYFVLGTILLVVCCIVLFISGTQYVTNDMYYKINAITGYFVGLIGLIMLLICRGKHLFWNVLLAITNFLLVMWLFGAYSNSIWGFLANVPFLVIYLRTRDLMGK